MALEQGLHPHLTMHFKTSYDPYVAQGADTQSTQYSHASLLFLFPQLCLLGGANSQTSQGYCWHHLTGGSWDPTTPFLS